MVLQRLLYTRCRLAHAVTTLNRTLADEPFLPSFYVTVEWYVLQTSAISATGI
jgi:hypothetical protein